MWVRGSFQRLYPEFLQWNQPFLFKTIRAVLNLLKVLGIGSAFCCVAAGDAFRLEYSLESVEFKLFGFPPWLERSTIYKAKSFLISKC